MTWQVTEPYDRADVAGDEAVWQLTWLAGTWTNRV
jgi:hypothetical protein